MEEAPVFSVKTPVCGKHNRSDAHTLPLMPTTSELPEHFDVEKSPRQASLDEEKGVRRPFAVGTSSSAQAWLTGE